MFSYSLRRWWRDVSVFSVGYISTWVAFWRSVSIFPFLLHELFSYSLRKWWKGVRIFSNGYIPTWLAIFVSRFIFLFYGFCIVRFND